MGDEPEIAADGHHETNEISTMTDDPRFRSDEMLECPTCSRTNPPNRVACLYCGNDLEIEELLPSAIKLNLQQPEHWEDGFTIAYIGQDEIAIEVTARAAEILHLEVDKLNLITRSNTAGPVVYLRSLSEAHIVASRLTEIGFPCAITGDDLLTPRTPPSRLRGIEFGETVATLLDFNTSSRFEFAGTDQLLLVTGVIRKTRSETTAKRSKRSMKVTDTAESLNDETVLDIYPPSDVFGFRVRPSGFDFSCLGDRMQRTGAENMQILTEEILNRFLAAKLIDTYRSLQLVLDDIWPVGESDRSSSVSRASFGSVRVHRVSITDNATQFNRFSRLQRHLL
jgi:hypothetical protein